MPRMRRLLAIFLLLILPTQVAFAFSASYCHGEAVQVQEHFGHHEDAPAAPASTGESPDADCIVCHLACAQMPSVVQRAMTLPALSIAALPWDAPPPQHLSDCLERPPRSALA
jgi:hypothetical protein